MDGRSRVLVGRRFGRARLGESVTNQPPLASLSSLRIERTYRSRRPHRRPIRWAPRTERLGRVARASVLRSERGTPVPTKRPATRRVRLAQPIGRTDRGVGTRRNTANAKRDRNEERARLAESPKMSRGGHVVFGRAESARRDRIAGGCWRATSNATGGERRVGGRAGGRTGGQRGWLVGSGSERRGKARVQSNEGGESTPRRMRKRNADQGRRAGAAEFSR